MTFLKKERNERWDELQHVDSPEQRAGGVFVFQFPVVVVGDETLASDRESRRDGGTDGRTRYR